MGGRRDLRITRTDTAGNGLPPLRRLARKVGLACPPRISSNVPSRGVSPDLMKSYLVQVNRTTHRQMLDGAGHARLNTTKLGERLASVIHCAGAVHVVETDPDGPMKSIFVRAHASFLTADAADTAQATLQDSSLDDLKRLLANERCRLDLT